MNELKVLYAIFTLLTCGGVLILCISLLKRRLYPDIYFAYAMELCNITLVVVPVYFSGKWLLVSALVLGGCCSYEMAKTVTKNYFVITSNLLLTIICICSFYLKLYDVVACVYIFFAICTLVHLVFVGCIRTSTENLFVAFYPLLFFNYFLMLANSDQGFVYIVLLYAIVEVNDAIAYVFGKAFGRRKICPTISPNKTYVGSIAGMIAAIITGFAMSFAVTDFANGQLGLLIVLIAIFGVIGDLVASKIKRIYYVKDFGRIIPGQGGMLDVLDSLIFTSPLCYYFLYFNGLI